MFRKIILSITATLFAIAAQAQISPPGANDIMLTVARGDGTFQSRYIETDKTGALQFLMFGQDPTPGAPVGQLRAQKRTLDASIICGPLTTSTCGVNTSGMTVYAAQVQDSSSVGRAVMTAADGAAARLAIGAGTSSFDGTYAGLSGVPSTFAPSTHTHPASQISDATSAGRAILTAVDASAMRGLLSVQTVTEAQAMFYPQSSNPAGYLTTISGAQVNAALGFTPYSAANPSGYITSSSLSPYLTSATAASTYATSASVTSGLAAKADSSALTAGLATKFTTPAGTTAQYVRGDGSLATLPAAGTGTVTSITAGTGLSGGTITTSGTISLPNTGTAGTYNNVTTDAQGRVTAGSNVKFDFSQPTARTLTVSTSYQASDSTKAAVIYPSYACQNATQVLASSACTIQVRMGTGTLTCSTGTVYYTQSLAVSLGVLLTQNSTNPVPVFLPIGASVIFCATAGTFTITTVEQSAG